MSGLPRLAGLMPARQADVDAAREEGRQAGLREAAEIARAQRAAHRQAADIASANARPKTMEGAWQRESAALDIAEAIEARAKEKQDGMAV